MQSTQMGFIGEAIGAAMGLVNIVRGGDLKAHRQETARRQAELAAQRRAQQTQLELARIGSKRAEATGQTAMKIAVIGGGVIVLIIAMKGLLSE